LRRACGCLPPGDVVAHQVCPPHSQAYRRETHALRVRHHARVRFAGSLHRALLPDRHPLRHLRRGDDLSVSLGGPVPRPGAVWPDRDAGVPGHPDRGVHLALEARRAGLDLDWTRRAAPAAFPASLRCLGPVRRLPLSACPDSLLATNFSPVIRWRVSLTPPEVFQMAYKGLSLEGKKALVFGGTSGLGKSIALGFAEAGADVVPVSRRAEEVSKAANEIRALGRRTLELTADVTKREDIQRVIDRMLAELGRIDILVNSAGTTKRVPSLDFPDEDWNRILNINLNGTWY